MDIEDLIDIFEDASIGLLGDNQDSELESSVSSVISCNSSILTQPDSCNKGS